MTHARISDVEILISAEALHESSRPSRDPQVVVEGLDEVTLLRDTRSGGSIMLNHTAAMLWEFLDGETTVATIVDDVVSVTGLEREEITRDVLEAIRQFGRAGMLQGVAAVPQPPPPPVGEATGGLPVGEPVPDLQLADLDGTSRELTFSKGAWLAVNWSPTCGFCSKIATTLDEESPVLRAAGVELVLIASGSPDQNREVLRETDLAPSTFLRDQSPPDMFEGLGTPVAYLIRDGRTVAPLALGAIRVPELAQQAPELVVAEPERA